MTDRGDVDGVDLGRRGFLLKSGASLGGFLASPKLGLIAAAAGAMAGRTAEDSATAKTGALHALLRAGEPINSRGQPFGFDVSGVVAIDALAARPASRKLLVVGHDRPRTGCDERVALRSSGLSTLEVKLRADGRWAHDVTSDCNRRWDAETPVALDGGRLDSEGVLHRLQDVGGGLHRIASVAATPWNTALACERSGWIVEVSPLTGYAVRRASLGKLEPLATHVVAKAGEQVTVFILSTSQVFKFVSHQRFEPRRPEINRSILAIGELSALEFNPDAAGTGLWKSLTAGLETHDWDAFVRAPLLSARLPAPLSPASAREEFENLAKTAPQPELFKGEELDASGEARLVARIQVLSPSTV